MLIPYMGSQVLIPETLDALRRVLTNHTKINLGPAKSQYYLAKSQQPFLFRMNDSAHHVYLRHSTFFFAIACTLHAEQHQYIKNRPKYQCLPQYSQIPRPQ